MDKMKKYVKKSIVVEAEQWFCWKDLKEIVLKYPYENKDICQRCGLKIDDHGWVLTWEGGHIACPADWIVKGIKGEYYPVKPDIFEQTYDEINDEETKEIENE